MWIRTYGRLYQKLCSTTCEIPIGIYRTQETTNLDASHVSNSPVNSTFSFGGMFGKQKDCVRLQPAVSPKTNNKQKVKLSHPLTSSLLHQVKNPVFAHKFIVRNEIFSFCFVFCLLRKMISETQFLQKSAKCSLTMKRSMFR